MTSLISITDALHATRLLQVEERPFQRVTRNLLGKDSLLRWTPPRQLPSPPPDAEDEANITSEDTSAEDARKRAQFRADILLDFAALESSILRIQLIQSSNARERERYAAEKANIMQTAQSGRENTVALRSQLVEAQKMLALRKRYDELATSLIFEKKLKPRAETMDDIAGLEKEIEDMEQEGTDMEGVWNGRREAWERVVAEGASLVKVIKGIRDESEGDERMEDGDEDTIKEQRSRMGTPVPGSSTPMRIGGDRTPMNGGGDTPLPEDGRSPAPLINKFLDVDEEFTRSNSRIGSPMLQAAPSVDDSQMELESQEQTQSASLTGDQTQVKVDMEIDTAPAEKLDQPQQAEASGVTDFMDES